ncbi:MAG: ATPase, T2SS/T4P/T4SS family [Albidovulum sp.]|nr:ATPase, T2SS/T4P/T4SS family [Albidovulum sp.]
MTNEAKRARALEIDPSNGGCLLLPNEPSRISLDDFKRLLMSCVYSGASDVTIQSDQQPRAEISGLLYRVGRRPWSPTEVDAVLAETFQAPNASAEIKGLRILDFSYEINLGEGGKQRFRVNATGVHGFDGFGVEITFRVLPRTTPDLAFADISEAEAEAMSPRSGLVVVAGATGSGKSATLAALARHHLENSARPVKIVDLQAPIEYAFCDIAPIRSGSPSIVGQSEIGRHVESFAAGVRSALRRKPHIVIVGEARDLPTVSAALEASLTGHLVYTTTHAGSVAEGVRRLLAVFPAKERAMRASDLAASLRFFSVQHLVAKSAGSGRVPVREYLSFDDPFRETLASVPPSEWPRKIKDAIESGGADRPLRQSLRRAVLDRLKSKAIARRDAARLIGDIDESAMEDA